MGQQRIETALDALDARLVGVGLHLQRGGSACSIRRSVEAAPADQIKDAGHRHLNRDGLDVEEVGLLRPTSRSERRSHPL